MMNRWPATACILVLAAMFTLGGLTAASADVVNLDYFAVTLNGVPLFNDSFSAGLTLPGGSGTVLPSGTTFSDGITPAFYGVYGTVTETGNKAILNTASGDHVIGALHRLAAAGIPLLLRLLKETH